MYTVSSRTLRFLLNAGAELGVDRNSVSTSAGVTDELLRDPEGRAPWPVYERLVQAMCLASDDPELGIHLACKARRGDLGIYDYLIRNSATVRDAVARACSFSGLISDATTLKMLASDDEVSVSVTPRFAVDARLARFDAQGWLGGVVAVTREMAGDRFHPHALMFPFSRPANTAEYVRLFGIEPTFDETAVGASMSLSAETLGRRLANADPILGEVLERCAFRQLEQLTRDAPSVDSVPSIGSIPSNGARRSQIGAPGVSETGASPHSGDVATRHAELSELIALAIDRIEHLVRAADRSDRGFEDSVVAALDALQQIRAIVGRNGVAGSSDRTSIEVSEIRGAITRELRAGEPSLEKVAKRAGMSARTLQRRLRGRGVSFKKLLDDVRRSLALQYVDDHSRSISEITFLLGFSSVGAFSRAFRRWTGEAPTRYRQKFRGP